MDQDSSSCSVSQTLYTVSGPRFTSLIMPEPLSSHPNRSRQRCSRGPSNSKGSYVRRIHQRKCGGRFLYRRSTEDQEEIYSGMCYYVRLLSLQLTSLDDQTSGSSHSFDSSQRVDSTVVSAWRSVKSFGGRVGNRSKASMAS